MNSLIEHKLSGLFSCTFNEEVVSIKELPGSGSNRKYFRIIGESIHVIGAFNEDKRENQAFFSFTKHFLNHNLNVPEIYSVDEISGLYLLHDLGDNSLFSLITKSSNENDFSTTIIDLYKKSLEELIKFQVVAGKDLDYSVCYPRSVFDQQSMQWDLNYFKYYYLKLVDIPFNEQKLEDDFTNLIEFLIKADSNYFMYRDFQSRNIMVYNNVPYFIDYQGGRKGPLQYDVASLLFQAKANIPDNLREELLKYYLSKLHEYIKIDGRTFVDYYYGFVLIRLLQVLGAYGYRGYYEKKPHFIESIKFAKKNLSWYVANIKMPVNIPELYRCFELMHDKDIKDHD